MKDLDNPSDEGKHTLGLSVSDSPHFCAQSQCCLSLLVSKPMPVCSVYVKTVLRVCSCVRASVCAVSTGGGAS